MIPQETYQENPIKTKQETEAVNNALFSQRITKEQAHALEFSEKYGFLKVRRKAKERLSEYKQILDELVRNNQGLVKNIIYSRFLNDGESYLEYPSYLSYQELKAAGNEGLLRGLIMYNPNYRIKNGNSIKFSTYVWKSIYRAIKREIAINSKHSKEIIVAPHIFELISKPISSNEIDKDIKEILEKKSKNYLN